MTALVVREANMPGKCAEPAPPAIMTSVLLVSRSDTNFSIFLGARCAATIAILYEI
jgi:hypothetical protein